LKKMAGPTASVLLPCSAIADGKLVTLMRALDKNSAAADSDLSDFQISDCTLIGGGMLDTSRPFGLSLQTVVEADRDRNPVFVKNFGFTPTVEIGVWAMCNDNIDHKVLGLLCAHLADTLNGIVDLGGALLPSGFSLDLHSPPNWSEVSGDVQRYVETMVGHAVAIPYETISGRMWATHFVDAQFLRSWLGNPEFRMIK
jgi:Family of unknown function (DUF6368)